MRIKYCFGISQNGLRKECAAGVCSNVERSIIFESAKLSAKTLQYLMALSEEIATQVDSHCDYENSKSPWYYEDVTAGVKQVFLLNYDTCVHPQSQTMHQSVCLAHFDHDNLSVEEIEKQVAKMHEDFYSTVKKTEKHNRKMQWRDTFRGFCSRFRNICVQVKKYFLSKIKLELHSIL